MQFLYYNSFTTHISDSLHSCNSKLLSSCYYGVILLFSDPYILIVALFQAHFFLSVLVAGHVWYVWYWSNVIRYGFYLHVTCSPVRRCTFLPSLCKDLRASVFWEATSHYLTTRLPKGHKGFMPSTNIDRWLAAGLVSTEPYAVNTYDICTYFAHVFEPISNDVNAVRRAVCGSAYLRPHYSSFRVVGPRGF